MFHAARRSLLTEILGNRHAMAATVLAVLAIPLSMSAGADGRRLTLGANRPAYEPIPMFPLPYEQLAAGPAFPLSRPPEPLTALPPAPRAAGPLPRSHVAEAPPNRVPPSPTQATKPSDAGAVTPDIKSDPALTRAKIGGHTPPRAEKASRHVYISAPHTKVTVRETSKREARVRVDAPFTRVAVDDGRVRVRAPFVNLDIRW